MQLTKTLILLASGLVPMAFAAQAAQPAVTSTVTLVPSGYTPPVSTPTPTPTPTPTSTLTPTSTPTPTSTLHSSSSISRAPSSTPLLKSTSTVVEVNTETATASSGSASASATEHKNAASMHQVSGAMAAGVVAIAGMLLI